MKAREVSTVVTLAALQAEITFAGPALKFSIAGTRPLACKAKNVTTTPAEFGKSTPTASPGSASRESLRPRICAERISLR